MIKGKVVSVSGSDEDFISSEFYATYHTPCDCVKNAAKYSVSSPKEKIAHLCNYAIMKSSCS